MPKSEKHNWDIRFNRNGWGMLFQIGDVFLDGQPILSWSGRLNGVHEVP